MKKNILLLATFLLCHPGEINAQSGIVLKDSLSPENIDYKTLDAITVDMKYDIQRREGTAQKVLS